MRSRRFWIDAIERAVRSVAQGMLFVWANRFVVPQAFAALDASSLKDTILLGVYVGLSLGVLSLLTSIATSGVGADKSSPAVFSDLEHQGLI